jgi:putative endonuclease
MNSYSVYVVRCSDGTLYTGVAQDVKQRIKEHNSGRAVGAKYTRSRTPVRLAYREDGYTHSEALSREYAVKQLTREEKEKLIRHKKKV